MKRRTCYTLILSAILAFMYTGAASAHFGVILPSADIVDQGSSRRVTLTLAFMHPFDQQGITLERPETFSVRNMGQTSDLTGSLTPFQVNGHRAWKCTFDIKRPGDHLFYMKPRPYWEPAEGKYIQHLTKVIVNAFGLEEGWSEPLGLEAEIVPLTRPYGLWTGNLFCGRALLGSKPAPHTTVEVEYMNTQKAIKAPYPAFVTQTLLTDSQGQFCYSIPRQGWWGFAALNESGRKMTRDGRQVPLELGAVIWVHATDMRQE